MPVRLRLLGPPSLDCVGAPVLLPFERRTQLLVTLALRGGWTGRAEIAALLWPEQTASLALMYLRKTLFRLRGLPWAGSVQVQGGSLRVEADTDLQRFEHALREQRPQDALALHAGPLLAGFDDDANEAWTGWLQFERARVQSAWRAAVLAWLESGAVVDGAQALQWTARLLEADPLDEAALRLQMTLLAQSGQAARAHQAYREFAARLSDDLGITPGPELKSLHDALCLAGAADSAGHDGASPAATATPAADTSVDAGFIGRAVERRRIHELLTGDAVRLLCIVGPGGIGKTRLARCALHDLQAAFVDGALFVALEDVASADEVARCIAGSAGLALHGREPPLQQLSQALGNGRRLLVLDNFEQLAGEGTALQTLLAACPRLKLLVTSRIRLGLTAEHLLPLEGLPCPEPEDLDRFAAFDAARLFISAAQRVEPALVAAAEAAAIVDICRQVDGLPLALELAAAWTRVLSCQTIASELRSGTALLQAQGAAHPRHASIEQVFEQAWRQLGSAERQTLARLSTFHGGFTADAARAVTMCALPVLGSLADKSLLRKEGPRLSLHPLVQQFAAAHLTVAERASTQAAHALYFHRLLAQLGAGVELGERAALQAVDKELQNLLPVLDWAIHQGQAEATQRCADVLCKYFEHRGGFETGLQLLKEAIEAPQLQAHDALQTWLRCRSAQFLYRLDHASEAEAVAQAALRGASRGGDASMRLRALNVVALCALRQGRVAGARLLFQQVHALATTQGEGRLTAATLDHLALVEKRLGNYGDALRLSLEALAQHRAEGDEAREALCLNNLAALYQLRDNVEAAVSPLHEALAICERNGLVATTAYVLANLVDVTMALGDHAQAEKHAARALEVAEACGNRAAHIWVQAQQGRLAVRRGDSAAAAATLAAALSRARESALTQGCTPALLGFAELLHASGDAVCAQRVLSIAADHASMSAHERDELLAQRARWGGGAETGAAVPPTVDYGELVHRIVIEAPDGHAALRALLRGSAATTPSPC